MTFPLAEPLGAGIFIAAFAAGLAARLLFPPAGKHAAEFAEQSGQLLNLAVCFLFGLTVGGVLTDRTPRFFVYGVLSVLLLGFSAQPGIAWYARRAGAFPPGAPELDA